MFVNNYILLLVQKLEIVYLLPLICNNIIRLIWEVLHLIQFTAYIWYGIGKSQ